MGPREAKRSLPAARSEGRERGAFSLRTHIRVMALRVGMLIPALALFGGESIAEMAEDILRMPTDSAQSHLFPINPAAHKPAAVQGGALLITKSRESELNQDNSGGDTIRTKSSVEYVALGALLDLGAGAGLGLTHQTRYETLSTSFSSNPNNEVEELIKQQQSTAKLYIELTENVKAAMAIRYLFKEWSVYGDPFLGDDQRTIYAASMVGYGNGFLVGTDTYGLAYAYYPPLRGKASVQGEEMIIVEPGEIVVDTFYNVNKALRLGASYKRWLHELDERKEGTTSDDEQTNISLYGLDVDQYVFPTHSLLLGADYQVNKQIGLRGAAGQEEVEFNFREIMTYRRIDVDQDQDHHEYVKYNRFKLMVTFSNKQIQLLAGLGLFERKHDFPSFMNEGAYETTGRETFVSIDMKL